MQRVLGRDERKGGKGEARMKKEKAGMLGRE